MQAKLLIKLGLLLCISLFVAPTLLAQGKKPAPRQPTPEEVEKAEKTRKRPPTASIPAFQIRPVDGLKEMCLALLVDGQGGKLEEFIIFEKIPILEAIVSEAKKFGLTEESTGAAKAVTTRFSDKQYPNFVVDVSKLGKQTHFYVTMQNRQGKLTVDAGTIKRDDPNATAFLYDMLTRIQSATVPNPVQ
jgi:hypothetical protein